MGIIFMFAVYITFIVLILYAIIKHPYTCQPIDNDTDDGIAGLPGEEPSSY